VRGYGVDTGDFGGERRDSADTTAASVVGGCGDVVGVHWWEWIDDAGELEGLGVAN
jgi:hypothetical protein